MDGEKLCEEAGSAKALNVALLGVAAKSGALDITLPDIESELRKHIRPQFVDINMKALSLGAEAAC